MKMFEELDYQNTDLGELILRRRRSPSYAQDWIYEVTIAGEFLMSSAVNASEIALADIALEALAPKRALRVLVGGLGLGYTALAALRHPDVEEVVVLELLEPVLTWHRKGLVPAAKDLTADPRTKLVHADFFETMHEAPARFGVFDAILLDIDHSPDALLHARHASFYAERGTEDIAQHLTDGGIFALWSADPPDPTFLEWLAKTFASVEAAPFEFRIPHLDTTDTNTLVFARKPLR